MNAQSAVTQIPPTSKAAPAEPLTGKAYRGPAMEGSIARWYAKTRGTESQIADCRRQAIALTEHVPTGGEVLEVAPGPGYLTVEMARLGRFHVSALDISHTFVEIVQDNARRAGVAVAVRQGDASQMPFPDGRFDLIVCQAAFKNFSRPQTAVNEMYRVLRPGGEAKIQDMRREATDQGIRDEVRGMRLGGFRGAMTRRVLRGLRRRAYTVDQFRQFARASPFGDADVEVSGIGIDVRLRRTSAPTSQ